MGKKLIGLADKSALPNSQSAIGYFYLPQIFVIPAEAGIQPVVISMSYEGLDPGLRRDDGVNRTTATNLSSLAMPLAMKKMNDRLDSCKK